jgi:VanZ family protein
MLPLRHAPRWRIASSLLLICVLVAALMPAVWFWDDRREVLSWLGRIDKTMHVVVFAGLTLWFAGQYRQRSYWRIAAGLLAYGVLIELCQRMVGYRSAEWLDVTADAVGIIIGLLLASAGLGGWSQRFEARYLKQRD